MLFSAIFIGVFTIIFPDLVKGYNHNTYALMHNTNNDSDTFITNNKSEGINIGTLCLFKKIIIIIQKIIIIYIVNEIAMQVILMHKNFYYQNTYWLFWVPFFQ